MSATDAKLNEGSGTDNLRRPVKVMRTEQQWIAIFEAQRASGLSADKFCRANGIARSAYWKWRKRLGATNGAAVTQAAGPTFIRIPITAAAPSSIELEVGTMRVRLEGAATERVIDAIIQRIAAQA